MGMSDLPEIYAQAMRTEPKCECIYFRQITSAYVTTNIFHLGDSPARVGKLKECLACVFIWDHVNFDCG